MPIAVKAVVNPNDSTERLILFDNGNLVSVGGVPQVPMENEADWSPGSGILVPEAGPRRIYALVVTDWTTPSGYTLSNDGFIFAFGTATQPALEPGDIAGGNDRTFIDLTMDPAANGQGYALRYNGTIETSGGAVAIDNRPTPDGIARRIFMPDYVTREYWVLDGWGRFFARHSAPSISVGGFPAEAVLWRDDIAMGAHILDDTGAGWLGHRWGFVEQLNGAQEPDGWQTLFRERDPIYSDIVVVDDGLGANPLRFGLLTIYGTILEYVASTAPQVIVRSPDDPTTDTTRPQIAWAFIDAEGDAQKTVQIRVFTDAQYLAGSPVNEVQSVALTGSPTGGNFKLTLPWVNEETADIAWNATAAAVQSALEALPSVAVGDVAVSGGPLPGTAVSVTFQGSLAAHDWPLMTGTDTLTGGTSPAVAVTQTTAGVGIDPGDTDNPVFEADLGAADLHVRLVDIDIDLTNDTYRAYVRASDTSDLFSPWHYKQWLQNVTVPATPTLTASESGTLGDVLLQVQAWNAAMFPGASGDYVSTPDSVPLSITGDLDLRVRAAADDWTPASIGTLVAKRVTTANQRSYMLRLLTDGTLQFSWSNDGTAELNATSIATGIPDGEARFVRVTIDVDNGAAGRTITFYTSTDGLTWTQLGSPVVQAGTTSIFDSTSAVEIGTRQTGTIEPFDGTIYYVEIRNGIDGTIVASPRFTGTPTFQDGQGNTWTVNGNVTVNAPVGTRLGVQYRDDETQPWRWVLNGWELIPDGLLHANVTDHTIIYGRQRCYRAIYYVPDPLLVSLFSVEECITVSPTGCFWTLVDPEGTWSGLRITVSGEHRRTFDREVISRTYWPDGRAEATVMSSGGPRSRIVPLELFSLSAGDQEVLERLLGGTRLYFYRDLLGNAWFVKLSGNVRYDRITPDPRSTEESELVYHLSLPLTEVGRPVSGPTTGPLALLS